MPRSARSSRTCWRVNCSRARNASVPCCASWSKKRWTAAEIPSKRRCSHTSSTVRTRISMEPAIQSCAWTRVACGTNFGNTTPTPRRIRSSSRCRKAAMFPPSSSLRVRLPRLTSHLSPVRQNRRTPCLLLPLRLFSGRGRPGGECSSGVALLWRWEWLALAAGGYAALSLRSTASAGRIMLAVMPSQNLTGDPEQEYLSDGLTEELIAVLGGVNSSRLGIIARTSAMHYKNSSKRADEIGNELGVDYLLETSLRRIGDRVLITAQLIDVETQAQVWVNRYERDARDVVVLQRQVAAAVARQATESLAVPPRNLRLRSSAGESPRLRGVSPRALPLGQGHD